MTGFLQTLKRFSICSRTAFAGGLESTIITLTASSCSIASIMSMTVMPPTASDRSRPPVPMALVTPSPRRSMMQVNS